MSELNIIHIINNIKFDWVIIMNVEVHLNMKNVRGGNPAIFIINIVSIILKFFNLIWWNLIDIFDTFMINEIDPIIIVYVYI